MLAAAALAAAFLQPISQLVATAGQVQLMASYSKGWRRCWPCCASRKALKVQPPRRLAGRIEVRQLDFRYHERSPLVLENISFSVPAGAFVALVGRSGAGKTTLSPAASASAWPWPARC